MRPASGARWDWRPSAAGGGKSEGDNGQRSKNRRKGASPNGFSGTATRPEGITRRSWMGSTCSTFCNIKCVLAVLSGQYCRHFWVNFGSQCSKILVKKLLKAREKCENFGKTDCVPFLSHKPH